MKKLILFSIFICLASFNLMGQNNQNKKVETNLKKVNINYFNFLQGNWVDKSDTELFLKFSNDQLDTNSRDFYVGKFYLCSGDCVYNTDSKFGNTFNFLVTGGMNSSSCYKIQEINDNEMKLTNHRNQNEVYYFIKKIEQN